MSSLRRGKMPAKTLYVACTSVFGSGQRDKPQRDHAEPPTQRRHADKRGNERARGEKTRSILKVKLPKLAARILSKEKATKEDETPGSSVLEPATNISKTPASGGAERQGVGADSDSVGGDVFFFSQSPTAKAVNEKGKAKLAVVRTISRMLEENQLIRHRLIALSRAR